MKSGGHKIMRKLVILALVIILAGSVFPSALAADEITLLFPGMAAKGEISYLQFGKEMVHPPSPLWREVARGDGWIVISTSVYSDDYFLQCYSLGGSQGLNYALAVPVAPIDLNAAFYRVIVSDSNVYSVVLMQTDEKRGEPYEKIVGSNEIYKGVGYIITSSDDIYSSVNVGGLKRYPVDEVVKKPSGLDDPRLADKGITFTPITFAEMAKELKLTNEAIKALGFDPVSLAAAPIDASSETVSTGDGEKTEGYIGVAIAEGGVNLRSGPAADYKAVGKTSSGQVFDVIRQDEKSKWFCVELPDGSQAWISNKKVVFTSN